MAEADDTARVGIIAVEVNEIGGRSRIDRIGGIPAEGLLHCVGSVLMDVIRSDAFAGCGNEQQRENAEQQQAECGHELFPAFDSIASSDCRKVRRVKTDDL